MPSAPRIAALLALAGAAAFASACSGGGGSSPVPTASTSPSSTSPASTPTPWNPTIQEFSVGSNPTDIAIGADGDLWFNEPNVGKIGRMAASGTLVGEYSVPNALQLLSGITLGSDNNVWFGDANGFIAKIDTSANITEVPLSASTSPVFLTSGSDGNIWFTTTSGTIGKLVPTSTTPTFYSPSAASAPFEITKGPNSDIWFSEPPGRIGRIATDGTGFQEFPIPIPSASFEPVGLTTGPDGAVWTLGAAANTNHVSQIGYVVRVTTSGQISLFQGPSQPSSPADIITGPDGFLYATESTGVNNTGQIMKITPQNGKIDEIVLPSGSNSAPGGIVVGSDGNIWFAETGSSKIGRLLLH